MGHQQWAVTALSGRYSGGAFTSLAVDTPEELELCVEATSPPQASGLVKDSLCLHLKAAEPPTRILLLDFAVVAAYRLRATAPVKHNIL